MHGECTKVQFEIILINLPGNMDKNDKKWPYNTIFTA